MFICPSRFPLCPLNFKNHINNINLFIPNYCKVSWCSWLSHVFYVHRVPGSNPGGTIFISFLITTYIKHQKHITYNTSTKKKGFILNHPYHQNIKQIYHFLLLHSTYHFYDYPVSYYSIYILNIMIFISHFIFMFSTFITLTYSILDPLNVIFALSTISKYILKSKLINK